MKDIVPYVFQASDALDVDYWNMNALELTELLREKMTRRFTHSSVRIPLNGISDSSDVGARTWMVLVPSSSDIVIEVRSVRLVVWGTDAKTVTVSATGAPEFEGFVVTMLGATDDEATIDNERVEGVSVTPFTQDDANTAKAIVVEVESGGTITQGWLEVDIRVDAAAQGSSPSWDDHGPYLAAAGGITDFEECDPEHENFKTAVDQLEAAKHVRCEVYAIQNPVASATYQWRVPAGSQVISHMVSYINRTAGSSNNVWTLDDQGGTPQGVTIHTGSGATEQEATVGDTVPVTDLDDSNDDYTLELVVGSGNTVDLAWCALWYND